MEPDQLGKQLEHAGRLGSGQPSRPGIDRAEGAKEPAVPPENRKRYVALESIHRRSRMAAIGLVLGHMVDDDRSAGIADIVTDRRLDLQFLARVKSEPDLVAHAAGDPTILRDPCHRGKTHARRPANDLEDRRHGIDPGDRGNAGFDISGHGPLDLTHSPRIVSPSRLSVTTRAPGRFAGTTVPATRPGTAFPDYNK